MFWWLLKKNGLFCGECSGVVSFEEVHPAAKPPQFVIAVPRMPKPLDYSCPISPIQAPFGAYV